MFHLRENDYLVREGDKATCGFLIETGSVEVLLERPDGNRILAVLGPGEIVGEMALVDQSVRSASVRAREDCLLLPITADHLAKRLAAADPVLRLVLGTILDRFRATLSSVGGTAAAKHAFKKRDPVINAAATAELRIQKELEVALREGQIGIHYQPIVQLSDGRISGFEALARWSHPKLGLVPPSTFVPIAEACGLSASLAISCIRQVTQDLPSLRSRAEACREHVCAPRIAVNISGSDLVVAHFIRDLDAAASQRGSDAEAITLELTETALVHNPSAAAEALHQARRCGFKIAVDDFGTGYSSLNYIRNLPVDILKIDKSFVQGMADCATTQSIVASMLQLADSLELTVVGEGIETAAQNALLRMLGCTLGQGYLFGRPLPLEQTLDQMSAWRATRVRPPPICAQSA